MVSFIPLINLFYSVGKTSILEQYCLNKFTLKYVRSIGADFRTKSMNLDENAIQLQIWDISGEERYFSPGRPFIRNTDCCALVFDLTNQASFDSLEQWRKAFLEGLQPKDPEKYPFVLLGNKSDEKDERKVKDEDIKQYCEKHPNMTYFEISAREDINLNEAFLKIAKLALKQNALTEETFEQIIPKYLKLEINNKEKREKEEKKDDEANNPEKDQGDNKNESLDNKELKSMNRKLKKELLKTKKLLKELKNNKKDHINDYTKLLEENRSLKYKLFFQEEEINYLKMKIQIYEKKEPKKNEKNNLEIFFVPNDNSYHECFECLETDTFAEIEEKLYKKHEELRNNNNLFISNGIIINRLKTISENKINDGNIIRIYQK